MTSKNIEVLYDDRGFGPGPMFKDADLLGLPVRVVLGERDYSSSGELEVKVRATGETFKVKKEGLVGKVTALLDSLMSLK